MFSVYLGSRILYMHVKCDALKDAHKLLDEMPVKSIASWTAMISGFARNARHSEALGLFVRMMTTGILPNEYTLASILTSCCGAHGLDHGQQVHSVSIKLSFQSHIFVGSSLLDMYAKAGEIHKARLVFDNLSEKDVVSCTAIISGYAQLGLDCEALELFRTLYRDGMQCNYVTFASLLTSLSDLAALDYGRQVHGMAIRSQADPSQIVLQNSLIDMYSKCGSLVYSRRVFDSMADRSVISWNAMLAGYAKHGLGQEAVELFSSMRGDIKPNAATYMAVLSACSHAGLVDEGLRIFDIMPEGDHERSPEIGHYGCMVDLLGRAGRINKAFAFIEEMPFEPTTAIWGSLLGACKVDVPAAEFVLQRLLSLEPENAGNYVIMSKIYAAAGKWEEAMRVRVMMEEKTVMKESGRSQIKLGGGSECL